MLNYLYAVVESEARLAAVALGLDAGLGVLHADTHSRDSVACDLMEPIRPAVDAYVLQWLLQHPIRRKWFFEERNGSCRLMGSFVEQLSATAPTWAQMIGPIAERFAEAVWSTVQTSERRGGPKTPLTQRRRREASGVGLATVRRPPRAPRVCHRCGEQLTTGVYCGPCNTVTVSLSRQPTSRSSTAATERFSDKHQRTTSAISSSPRPRPKTA